MPKNLDQQYNFRRHAYKAAIGIQPERRINLQVQNELNAIVHYLISKIMHHVGLLMANSPVRTIREAEIHLAVKIVMPGWMKRHAVNSGVDAVIAASQARQRRSVRGRTRQAGLHFSVPRVEHLIRHYSPSQARRVGREAAIYLAAVIEYVITEILEIASNSDVPISVQDIYYAVRGDDDLRELLAQMPRLSISGGNLALP